MGTAGRARPVGWPSQERGRQVVEEAAQAAINAQVLGGPVEIPGDMRAAALQRAMVFDAAGTMNA